MEFIWFFFALICLSRGQNISETCEFSLVEVEAAAADIVSSALNGVCNPHEMELQLKSLEKTLTDQFIVVKTMLLDIEKKLLSHDAKLHELVKPTNKRRHVKDKQRYNKKIISLREDDINQFNNTISEHHGKKQFRYYWKVTDINYKITSWGSRRSQRSETLEIWNGGYKMYMRIYPRQNTKNFYIHVGLTSGENDNSLKWPFRLKHKVQVLDFSRIPQDIASRVWDPRELCSGWNWRQPIEDSFICVGLGFPNNVLRTRNFIIDDSIIIQLTVFLED